jgi:hypothetical protein
VHLIKYKKLCIPFANGIFVLFITLWLSVENLCHSGPANQRKNKPSLYPYYMTIWSQRISISHVIHSVKLELRCVTCFRSFNRLAGTDSITNVYFLDVDTHTQVHTHTHTLMHAQRYTNAPTHIRKRRPHRSTFNIPAICNIYFYDGQNMHFQPKYLIIVEIQYPQCPVSVSKVTEFEPNRWTPIEWFWLLRH